MGWLERMDRRNQSVANYLMDHPEAGTESFPYAKSARGRRLAIGGVVLAFLVTFLFGVITGLIVGATVTALTWRLHDHPWWTEYRRNRTPPT